MLQGSGAGDEAEADVAEYVAGGLPPLHYSNVKYLPCYAAAGARIRLGYFDESGQVHAEAIVGSACACTSLKLKHVHATCQW